MIISNLLTKEVKITEETCPVCHNTDRHISWKSVFYYCGEDSKEEETDFNNESYYMCAECGYFHRERKGGKSRIFKSYRVEGISIKEFEASEYGPGIYSQIENLSIHRNAAVGFRIIDHKKYEPDFYNQRILNVEEEE